VAAVIEPKAAEVPVVSMELRERCTPPVDKCLDFHTIVSFSDGGGQGGGCQGERGGGRGPKGRFTLFHALDGKVNR